MRAAIRAAARAPPSHFDVIVRDTHGRIHGHIAAFRMPAEHDRGRIARRKETFRPVQNRVHIPIRGFLGRHRATHRHIEILLPSDKRAIGATEGYIQRIDGSATHVERHRGELLLFALAQTLRVLADTQRAETRRFADGTQQREPILVHIGGIRNEHVVIAFRTQQLSNRHRRHRPRLAERRNQAGKPHI